MSNIGKIYTQPSSPGFAEDFLKLFQLAREKAVGFSLIYEEAADTWYVQVSSAAEQENFIGKSRPLCFAISDAFEHLNSI